MQVHPVADAFTQQMSFGLMAATSCVFGWFALDTERFIRFWLLKPPYKPRTVLVFRVLFIIWSLGGIYDAINLLLRMDEPSRHWFPLIKYSTLWSVIWWLMVNLVEWTNRRRRRNIDPSVPPHSGNIE